MFFSGSENRAVDMNDSFVDKLWSLDKSRRGQFAVISTRNVENILGAQVPLPDNSVEELERSGVHVIDEEWRECLSGGGESSTLLKIHVPNYSKRKSSILEETP